MRSPVPGLATSRPLSSMGNEIPYGLSRACVILCGRRNLTLICQLLSRSCRAWVRYRACPICRTVRGGCLERLLVWAFGAPGVVRQPLTDFSDRYCDRGPGFPGREFSLQNGCTSLLHPISRVGSSSARRLYCRNTRTPSEPSPGYQTEAYGIILVEIRLAPDG